MFFSSQDSLLYIPTHHFARSPSMMKPLYESNPVTFLLREQAWKDCMTFIQCISSDGHTVGSNKELCCGYQLLFHVLS